MTDLTRVLAYRTEQEAGNAMLYWKGLDYHVAVAGPTDAIELYNGDEDKTWESGAESDWFLVVATKAKLEIAAGQKKDNGVGE
jgi:hypothetical protein